MCIDSVHLGTRWGTSSRDLATPLFFSLMILVFQLP
jgi:hypothetical protein